MKGLGAKLMLLLMGVLAMSVFVSCEDDDNKVEIPISVGDTVWTNSFSSDEIIKAVGGMFDTSQILSMKMTYYIYDNNEFRLETETKIAEKGIQREKFNGSYTYSSETGEIVLTYHDSIYGLNTDTGVIKRDKMVLSNWAVFYK